MCPAENHGAGPIGRRLRRRGGICPGGGWPEGRSCQAARTPRGGVELGAGRSGEPRGARTLGVEAGPVKRVTGEHTWDFPYRHKETGPAPKAKAANPIQVSQPSAAATGTALNSWSSVKNCTECAARSVLMESFAYSFADLMEDKRRNIWSLCICTA